MFRRHRVLLESRGTIIAVLSRRPKDAVPNPESLNVRSHSNNDAGEIPAVQSWQRWQSKAVIGGFPVPVVQKVSRGAKGESLSGGLTRDSDLSPPRVRGPHGVPRVQEVESRGRARSVP